MHADALMVVIGRKFPAAKGRHPRSEDPFFLLVREALATGKPLLPVTVEGVSMPESAVLPREIKRLAGVQAVSLGRKSDIPVVVARLILAVKQSASTPPSASTSHRKIFISYRRDDSWYWASLLARALSVRLSPDSVFFDLASLTPGTRFDEQIRANIERATEFLFVVGPAFLELDCKSRRRIDTKDDYMRREIDEAIHRRKLVHVVLAGGAKAPESRELPPDIAPAFKRVRPLTLANFEDAETVAEAITRTAPIPAGQAPFIQLRSPESSTPIIRLRQPERRAHALASAIHGLALLGWLPSAKPESHATLVFYRPDCAELRFRFDPEYCEAYLEELGRCWRALGLKHWIRRSVFSVSPDSLQDLDVLRLPDPLVEAAENPTAFLDRRARMDVDVDAGAQTPMRPGELERLISRGSRWDVRRERSNAETFAQRRKARGRVPRRRFSEARVNPGTRAGSEGDRGAWGNLRDSTLGR